MGKLSVWHALNQRYKRCVLCHDSATNCVLCPACRQDLQELYLKPDSLCPRCAGRSSGARVCGQCQQQPPPFAALWSSVLYQAPISTMLHALKYQADLSMLEPLLLLMIDRPPPWLGKVHLDGILAVPMSDTRRLARGFNQSDEMAAYVAAHYRLPLLSRHTLHKQHTVPQSTLKQADRYKNLKDAFRVDLNVKKSNILLIDDVCTTGETFLTLARILKQAGASEIYCWSLAHSK